MKFEIKDRVSANKISEIRSKLKNFLLSNEIPEETASDIELVISEMLTNVYKHSYKEKEGEVTVKASIDGDELTISIRDFGEKFSPTDIREPDPDFLADHGYGLYIASQIMDKIEYILSHETGTEVILKKLLKRNG
jgi:serine/threonine-protein kinase RsbW